MQAPALATERMRFGAREQLGADHVEAAVTQRTGRRPAA